jgi:hypothetical protein
MKNKVIGLFIFLFFVQFTFAQSKSNKSIAQQDTFAILLQRINEIDSLNRLIYNKLDDPKKEVPKSNPKENEKRFRTICDSVSKEKDIFCSNYLDSAQKACNKNLKNLKDSLAQIQNKKSDSLDRIKNSFLTRYSESVDIIIKKTNAVSIQNDLISIKLLFPETSEIFKKIGYLNIFFEAQELLSKKYEKSTIDKYVNILEGRLNEPMVKTSEEWKKLIQLLKGYEKNREEISEALKAISETYKKVEVSSVGKDFQKYKAVENMADIKSYAPDILKYPFLDNFLQECLLTLSIENPEPGVINRLQGKL